MKYMKRFSYSQIKEISKNIKFCDEGIQDKRNDKLELLIGYKNYDKMIANSSYSEYIIEKLGYNSSLKNYVNIISEKIFKCLSENINKIEFNLNINEIGISKVRILIDENYHTSVLRENDLLSIVCGFSKDINMNKIKSDIDHELHHIFIDAKGNVTKEEYYKVVNAIPKYTGKTQAFLYLYYLSFKDEISSNIQSFHREIGNNNIKTKEEFINFLHQSNLFTEAIKMKEIDIFKYWNEIKKENNVFNIIHDLGIGNLNKFLKDIDIQIRKAGSEYIKKLSRIFI